MTTTDSLDCARVEERQQAEAYVRGALAEADRDAFEAHLFECARCLERVEALRLLRVALEGEGAPTATPARKTPLARWAWLGAAASLAAVAIVATRAPQPRDPTRSPASPENATPHAPTDLSDLGRFQPPAYEPSALRGSVGDSERAFAKAMERYTAGDWGGALPGLKEAARLDPSAPAPPFFLGVCQLLTRRVSEGASSLQGTIALGDTPYLEPARFHLAKAHLLRGDALAALSELEGTILLRGDLEDEARSLALQVRERVEAPARR